MTKKKHQPTATPVSPLKRRRLDWLESIRVNTERHICSTGHLCTERITRIAERFGWVKYKDDLELLSAEISAEIDRPDRDQEEPF